MSVPTVVHGDSHRRSRSNVTDATPLPPASVAVSAPTVVCTIAGDVIAPAGGSVSYVIRIGSEYENVTSSLPWT